MNQDGFDEADFEVNPDNGNEEHFESVSESAENLTSATSGGKSLTPKEKKVLNFLQHYIKTHEHSPTFNEIQKHFDFASIFSVQRYLKQLEEKGHLKSAPKNKKRALELVSTNFASDRFKLPLLGKVAAGRPIEALLDHEFIDVPAMMIEGGGQYFALLVHGDSMKEDGIHDGDFVIVKKQSHANTGQTVVALVNNEATLKKYFKHKSHIELRPANSDYKPILVQSHQNFKIEGIYVGLIRMNTTH